MSFLNLRMLLDSGQNELSSMEQATLFLIVKNFLDIYAAVRQIRLISRTMALPKELQEFIDLETFNKARIYQLECEDVRICEALYRILVSFIVIQLEVPAMVWAKTVHQVMLYMPLKPECKEIWRQEILASCIFASVLICLHFVSKLPEKLFRVFLLEKSYNFTNITFGRFMKDQIMWLILTHVFVMPVIIGIVLLSPMENSQYFVGLWTFLAVIVSIWYFIIPVFIGVFYDFRPLCNSSLRNSIERLVNKVGFPIDSVYVASFSSRTNHSNAFVFGFGNTKKIVLFDTLLNGKSAKPTTTTIATATAKTGRRKSSSQSEEVVYTDDEILAIMAHELGHWKNGHVFINLFLMQLNLLLMLMLYSSHWYNNLEFYEAFGFINRIPTIPGIYLVYFYMLIPYHCLMKVMNNFISRVLERQADAFAAQHVPSSSLKSGFAKIYKHNLDFPFRDWVYEIWNSTHPSQFERITDVPESADDNKKSRCPLTN